MSRHHPAWRLLSADSAPLVISFLDRVFISPNVRTIAESELAAKLDDALYELAQIDPERAMLRTASQYLTDWASPERAWLRKYYAPGIDEPVYDLSPNVEKVVSWLKSLTERQFVGAESRLNTALALLKQMSYGSETDPAKRLETLIRERDEAQARLDRAMAGEVELMDNTAIKERFDQFASLTRDLLGDFREVDANFRALDRETREMVSGWVGPRGDVVGFVFDRLDSIEQSHQGKSFNAFFEIIYSETGREELAELIKTVMALPAVKEMNPDPRLARFHSDCFESARQTKRSLARLMQQLDIFLKQEHSGENSRIMATIHNIERQAIGLGGNFPEGDFMFINALTPTFNLPFERPLNLPTPKRSVDSTVLDDDDGDADFSALFQNPGIDRMRLVDNVHSFLKDRASITLAEVVARYPIERGVEEILVYLCPEEGGYHAELDESSMQQISWTVQTPAGPLVKTLGVPRAVFSK